MFASCGATAVGGREVSVDADDAWPGGIGCRLLSTVADLRWGRPELVAAVAEHVEDIESGDDRLWVTATGWLVHGRAAVGDGREAAVAALEQLPQRAAGLAHDPAAHRLRVEIALLAAAAGEYTVARALVAPVVLASAAAEDRADALGVLARCVAEERPEAVDEPARRAEIAWAEVGGPYGETGAATVALVAATGLRRAGRPGAAVERAAAGLSRLDRVRGRHPATPSRHLGAALAAEWIGALLDAGRADEAREGCVPLEPRLREVARPSRQMALLRLTVARALVASSPGATVSSTAVVDVLEQAAGDAAASDAPDLEAVCLSTLGALHERAGRLGAALDFTRRAVEARHRDAARRDRFLDALHAATPLTVVEEPAFDPWAQSWTPVDGDDTPIAASLARTLGTSDSLPGREPLRHLDPPRQPGTAVAGGHDASQQGRRARRADATPPAPPTKGSAGHRLAEPASAGGAPSAVPSLAAGRPDGPSSDDGPSNPRPIAADRLGAGHPDRAGVADPHRTGAAAVDPPGVDHAVAGAGVADRFGVDHPAAGADVAGRFGIDRPTDPTDSAAALLRDDRSRGAATIEPQHPPAQEPWSADRGFAAGREGGRRRRRDDDGPATGSDRPAGERADSSRRPRAPEAVPERGRPAAEVWPDVPGWAVGIDRPLGRTRAADRAGAAADSVLSVDGAPDPSSTLAPRPETAGAAARAEAGRRWDTTQDGWLQAALAELDRVLGPATTPTAPGPSANGAGCTVVVDVVRSGAAMPDRDPAGVLRAVAERLAAAVPAGGRLRRDEHTVSVVLPGWDCAEAGGWMRAALPEPFAELVSSDQEPGTALRAAVHDLDGPVGAQLLQRLDAVPPRRADAGRHDAAGRTPFAGDQPLPADRSGRRRRSEGDTTTWPSAGAGRANGEPAPARTDAPATAVLLGEPAGHGAVSDAPTGSDALSASDPAATDRRATTGEPWISSGASPADRSPPTERGTPAASTVAVPEGALAADPDTAGLGIADLLAGALAAYRGW